MVDTCDIGKCVSQRMKVLDGCTTRAYGLACRDNAMLRQKLVDSVGDACSIFRVIHCRMFRQDIWALFGGLKFRPVGSKLSKQFLHSRKHRDFKHHFCLVALPANKASMIIGTDVIPTQCADISKRQPRVGPYNEQRTAERIGGEILVQFGKLFWNKDVTAFGCGLHWIKAERVYDNPCIVFKTAEHGFNDRVVFVDCLVG